MTSESRASGSLVTCVRCGAKDLDYEEVVVRCPRAPDGAPHEGLYGEPEYDRRLHGVRRGFSLHIADCPLSDPSPWAVGAPCFCVRQSEPTNG